MQELIIQNKVNHLRLSLYPVSGNKHFWKLILLTDVKSGVTSCSHSGLGPILCGHWSPDWCLGTQLPAQAEGEAAAAFLFADSTSSYTEHVSQRETHRQTQTHTRGYRHVLSHRQPQARCWLQQRPSTQPTPDTATDRHDPSSSWAGRSRSLVQHTHHTPQVYMHTHICSFPEHYHGPSVHPAPVPRS